MKLHLIRHAKTKEAENNIHQNDDVSIIKELVDPVLYSDLKPDKVYSSPFLRAKQTAKMLFGNYEVLDLLHEFRSPNLLKGKPRAYGFEFWEKHLPDVRKNPDWSFDGSESFNDVIERVSKFLDFMKDSEYKRVAVVGHGTFFRHTLGVLKFGKSYSFEKYEKYMWPIKWRNLEMKEVEI